VTACANGQPGTKGSSYEDEDAQSATSQVKIRMLTGGDLQFEDDLSVLSAPIPRALFVILAMDAGHAISRDRLCDYFWPYTDQSTARKRLRMTLLNLKRGLSPDMSDRIQATSDNIALNVKPTEVDTLCLKALAGIGGQETLSKACDLYRGDLLTQFPPISDQFDRYAANQRDAFRTEMLSILHNNMRAHLATEDSVGFEKTCRFALQLDRTNSETTVLAMSAAAADGQVMRVREVFEFYKAATRELIGSNVPQMMEDLCDEYLQQAVNAGNLIARSQEHIKLDGEQDDPSDQPALNLRLLALPRWIVLTGIGALVALILVLGGLLWYRSPVHSASEGDVFLVRTARTVSGNCGARSDMDLFERSLLDALQNFEGSNTVLGPLRRRLIGNGPNIYEIEITSTCHDKSYVTILTAVNTVSRDVIWGSRYTLKPAQARELSRLIHKDLAIALSR
jgi:DNA-binding SARP family transcriptional activator